MKKLGEMMKEALLDHAGAERRGAEELVEEAVKAIVFAACAEIDWEELIYDAVAEALTEDDVKEAATEVAGEIVDEFI